LISIGDLWAIATVDEIDEKAMQGNKKSVAKKSKVA
jgi:hypothetical protein